MPEQALYLAWRPMRFEDVIGQEHITRTLRNSLKSGRVRHAYLFSGPRGTGKTTTARLLAKAINCAETDPGLRPCNACAACRAVNEGRYLDLIEIDAATHTGVDDVRDLRDKVAFAPGEGNFKVYIIDEVHRFTGNAFDALLKTLEEPPPHAVFVLATTEIDKVPATIRSRCLPFEFRRVPVQAVADHLQSIAEAEGLRIERQALELIARQGTGSVRDSISLLDQIVTNPDEEITLALAQDVLGTASNEAVRALLDALVAQDAATGLDLINRAVDAGSDPRQFGQQIVEQLRNLLLTQTASADLVVAPVEERQRYEAQAAAISRTLLLRALRKFNEALADDLGSWQPQLALELALVESLPVAGDETGRAVGPAAVAASEPATPAPAAAATMPAETSPVAPAPEARPATGAPADVPAPPASETLTLEQVQERWDAVRQAVQQQGRSYVPAMLEHVQVHDLRGDLVILGTRRNFHVRLNTADAREKLEMALQGLFGRPLRVRVQSIETDLEDEQIDPDDPLVAGAMAMGARISVQRPAKEGD
ncbi:MAG: DNA polymerase III subunit gamma/tau [Anaerolineaceae bacterium]|nr:DNA polymerase III subunit gamma/tau [Anaerolineaceae bacterium]